MVETQEKEATSAEEKVAENPVTPAKERKTGTSKETRTRILVTDYTEEEYEKMLNLYEKTFNVIKENELVKGKIVAINGEDVLIDIGSKSDGRVSVNEFSNSEDIVVGNTIEVFLEKIEDKEGQLILSKKKADSMKMWDNIVDAQTSGKIIKGKCIGRDRKSTRLNSSH